MNRFPILLLITILFTGCSTLRQPTTAAARPVTHVVLCWLKHPGNASERQALVDASRTFRQIPGVLTITAGSALPAAPARPGVDASFDVGLAIRFKNREALAAYEKHPIHLAAVRDVLIPLARKFIIYDFSEQ